MTQEETNCKVAELCGWRIIDRFKVTKCPDGSDWVIVRIIRPDGTTEDCLPWDMPNLLPNYSGSLDAMAEAEKTLTTWREKEAYARALYANTAYSVMHASDDDVEPFYALFETAVATPAQRCAAFLSVKGRGSE